MPGIVHAPLPAPLPAVAARPPSLTLALVALLVVVAVVELARLGSFMLDCRRREHSTLPLYDTFVRHSCLSAYHRADELARAGEPDLYRPALYTGSVGPFHQEIYEYPPPFLLLPRVLGAATGHDFFRLRALWFVLLAASVLAGLAVTAWRIGGGAGRTVALLAPAVLAAVPTLLALQYGNFHLAAVALSVLAFLALRVDGGGWRRLGAPAGGAVLAFVGWAKIFPALLLVPLLVERRWRAAGWTAAWALIWLLLAAAALGPAPLAAFFGHQLGQVASGTAFPFLAENERVIAANLSVYALALKLGALLGWRPPAALAGVLSAACAAALMVGLAVAWARRRAADDPLVALQLALAALFLGGMVSPFAPQPYAGFAGLWLLTLLVPGAAGARAAALAAAWLALAVMVHALPLHAGPTLIGLSLLTQLAALVPAVMAFRPSGHRRSC
jgi:glycosyl transferase family 87